MRRLHRLLAAGPGCRPAPKGPTVSTVESGPYRVNETWEDGSSVSGPYLRQYFVPRPEQARELAQLLNLAFAAGEIAERERRAKP